MESPEDTDDAVAEELARAAIYRLLAGSLTFPTTETRELFDAEVFAVLSELNTASPELDDSIRGVMSIHSLPIERLRRTHGTIFTHIESPDCPTYESAFCPGDVFRQAEVMADIAGFYAAHGLKFGGRVRERPDHITTELEFMAFLARKRAHAVGDLGPDEIEECERSQQHFLRDHLGCWGHAFATRLQLVAAGTPFEVVGRLVEQWLAEELDWLEVEPVATWIEPQPMPEPDDGLCGSGAMGLPGTPVELGSGR